MPVENMRRSVDETSMLRRGWTTGACAAAAASAAYAALLTGDFPDPVSVSLPNDVTPEFALASSKHGEDWARAAVVKDAGDDPDVTHGALVVATVRLGTFGTGVLFRAAEGVGTVTLPGLPLPPGEPAINPAPRAMISCAIRDIARRHGGSGDAVVEIGIPGGVKIAERTLNGRLGIVGGLSILGTTGIVVPYSCSAWIHSIHRGIDVAVAAGITHIAGSTGSTSEAAIKALHGLPDIALIEMGDFVGGMLKYLRVHPVRRITIAGGFGKMTKLAQGMLDLHSRRGTVDLSQVAAWVKLAGGQNSLADRIHGANTAKEAYDLAMAAGLNIATLVAERAWTPAATVLRGTDVLLDVALFDRAGTLIGRSNTRSTALCSPD